MRSGRKLIHICFSCGSVSSSHFNKFNNFFWFDDCPLGYTFNIDTFSTILSNLKISLFTSQQITNTFIVNLNVGSSHHKFSIFIFTTLDILKNIFNGSWYNPPFFIVQIILKSFHCISFSSSCLSVCKNGCIIAFQSRTNRKPGSSIINLRLFSIIIIDMIKGKLMH